MVLLAALVTPAALSQARAATPKAPPRAIKTAVVHISPVSKSGKVKADYSVGKSFPAASCEAGSEGIGSGYRCFAGKTNHSLNRVLDPCWVERDKRFVACLSEPWSFQIDELTVTKKFRNGGFTKKHAKLPWGVQLDNGIQCVFVQGAGSTIAHKRVNYFCPNTKVVLYGNVNSRGKTWTVRQATANGTHFTKNGRAQLSKAWFGKASRKG